MVLTQAASSGWVVLHWKKGINTASVCMLDICTNVLPTHLRCGTL
jgi:hypothetical protein